MIAIPIMLVSPAEKAGMKVPEDPDNFKREDYTHFFIFLTVQLGAPMPYPSAHWDNAKLIASLSDEEVKSVTYQQLLDKGLAVGNSYVYA